MKQQKLGSISRKSNWDNSHHSGKRGKAGPPSNLRPIILLSLLLKILAIIMIQRISGIILTRIPVTQAAYQTGRSTTEYVFAVKLLTEMALTHSNYTVHLLMLDISKDFDTVNRKTLFVIL